MSKVELLILNGPPGSGKSTIMNAISDKLREDDKACAVIDVDELSRVHPIDEKPVEWRKEFMWNNLKAIWPNYTTLGDIKIILPIAIDNNKDMGTLKAITMGSKIMICELTAPIENLQERINSREIKNTTRERLYWFIDRYLQRTTGDNKFCDFKITTNDKSIDDTAKEIIAKLGWLQ